MPAPEADASFDSTIVITPEEVAQMKSGGAAESVSAPPPSPFDEPRAMNRTAPTLEDIPTPSILSSGYARPTDPEISITSDSMPTKETPVYAEEPAPEAEPPVSDPGVATPPVAFEPTPAEEEAAAPEAEPAVVAEEEPKREPTYDLGPLPNTAEEEALSSFESETAPPIDTLEPEPISAIPLVSEPPVFEEPEPIETPMAAGASPSLEAAAPESSPDIPASTAEPEPESPGEREPTGISKPLDELEVPVETPSMFDSVRIMEGSEQPNQDGVDTVIPGRGFQMPVIKGPDERPKPIVSEPAEEPASRATPDTGLGMGDTDGRRSAKLKPLPEGTILNNRYEIVRKIGGGGMGAVYLASDNNLGGVLRAVKEMVQAHIEEDQQEKAINDFKRESMILSTLDHPSIPTIYDYFYDGEEGRFYLVMKYISGGDLASKLRSAPDGKIEELTVTEWAIQLTDVLNYLHNQPTTIVYRDLKPSNIMLDGNSSRVMLIDFGIARSITQKEEKGVTAVGTMGYAPPELFSGNVEPRSDIYSLGSTMFHLLTGADPQSNPLLIFDFQKNPRPRQINSRLSDQMERILMRMVEYNAEQRFSSAGELKAVLEEHLANLRSGNLSYGVTEAPISVSLANQSVFCGFCGQRIVATDLFCAFCGAKQPIAQQGVHSEIYHSGSAGTARLVIEGTSELSAPVYALQKDDNLIGRRDPMSNIFPEVDLSKYDPQTKISRRHAKIWRDGTAYMLEDLGSSNGTLIEGGAANIFKLPAHQPYKLSSGDKIKIGDTRLHFVVG